MRLLQKEVREIDCSRKVGAISDEKFESIEKRFVFTRIMKKMTKKISALRSKIMWDNFFYGLNKIVKHVLLIRLQKFYARIFPNFGNYTFLEADHGYAEVCTYLIVMQEIFKNIFINIFVYYLCDKIQKYFRNSFSVRYVLLYRINSTCCVWRNLYWEIF